MNLKKNLIGKTGSNLLINFFVRSLNLFIMSNKMFTQVSIIETLIEETNNGEIHWRNTRSKEVRLPIEDEEFGGKCRMEDMYREVFFAGGDKYFFRADLTHNKEDEYDLQRSVLKIVMPSDIDPKIRITCTATIHLEEDQARKLNQALRKNAYLYKGRTYNYFESEKIKEIIDFLLF